VFYAALNQPSMPVSKTLKKLENYFQRVDTHRELVWKRGSGGAPPRVAWHWGSFAGDLDLPEWALACSSEQFLTSSAMDQVRSCGSETCRWLFYDTSKNHSRRWCDMKICGNRMKARRFQQRRD
jgi:predicted RNA-binding Zn ribbon-like protein